MPRTADTKPRNKEVEQAPGRCVCGAVRLEIDVPVFWAWHDHSPASRHAQGCAYATYVGAWRKKFRIVAGAKSITRYEDKKAGTARSFCKNCGTPLLYERGKTPRMVNIPRALFATRTGREPRYHVGIEQQVEWIWRGETEKLGPLKGYPGVMLERPKRKKRRQPAPMF